MNKNDSSTSCDFDDFLKDEGIFEEVRHGALNKAHKAIESVQMVLSGNAIGAPMLTLLNDRQTAPPTDRLVTAEELLEHPEWGPCELIRGKVVQVCRPTTKHGILVTELAMRLNMFAREQKLAKVVSGDSGVVLERDPDTVRGPDVYVIRTEHLPGGRVPEKFMEVAPDLCIEIISPNDKWSDIEEKRDMYFAKGVRVMWVIDPRRRKANIFRNGMEKEVITADGELSGEEILPGFKLKLSDLFAALE